MHLRYDKKWFVIFSLLVVVGMSLLAQWRLQVIEQQRAEEVAELARSVARRVSKTILPSIWGIYQQASERRYTDDMASALLDFELEERHLIAINVFGNFGHLYMGRIKVDSDTIVAFDKSLHDKSSAIVHAKAVRNPIRQGHMTIGSVVVYYSESQYLQQHRLNVQAQFGDLVIITILILAILYFAYRMSQSREVSEKANRVKSEFLANMSHEIRTPMNAIFGLLELLRGSELTREQQSNLDIIYASSATLLNIINDVLDISKIEADKIDIDYHDVQVDELVSYLSIAFRELAYNKNLEFKLLIETDLPCDIRADETRIRQVLNNLISNAIKFTQQGSVTIKLGAEYEQASATNRKNCTLIFSILDTGIGIHPDNQQKLFNYFTQAESSTTRRFGGTGLGLAISQRLAKLMGGDISLISEEGKGSCFTYSQPVEVISTASVAAQCMTISRARQEQRKPSVSKRQSDKLVKKLILVVEDNAINRMVVGKQLRLLGLEADFAVDGKAGYMAWERGNYALMFSDCQMPEIDGYEMTRMIRQKEKETAEDKRIPIIAFTANAMLHDRERCVDAGMDDVISKPCNISDIEEKLRQWLPLQYRLNVGRSIEENAGG
jgi:signal transduction histidine kinase/ActR/RegA family two-component response regulator